MFFNHLDWIKTLVLLIILIFSAGCTVMDSYSDTDRQQSLFNNTVSTQTPTTQSNTPVVSTTAIGDMMTVSPKSSPRPIFTETGSMTDADGIPILSKSQAWNYAEKYLESRGLTNIQSDEVKAFEPRLFTDKENNQTLIWPFEIDRKDSMGFEHGGIIAIDTYNGDVVWYAEFE